MAHHGQQQHKGKEKESFKLNVDAASRDYHVNPRLGTSWPSSKSLNE